jgi:hypothetical protein
LAAMSSDPSATNLQTANEVKCLRMDIHSPTNLDEEIP